MRYKQQLSFESFQHTLNNKKNTINGFNDVFQTYEKLCTKIKTIIIIWINILRYKIGWGDFLYRNATYAGMIRLNQCCGSGSARIRIKKGLPDPDPGAKKA